MSIELGGLDWLVALDDFLLGLDQKNSIQPEIEDSALSTLALVSQKTLPEWPVDVDDAVLGAHRCLARVHIAAHQTYNPTLADAFSTDTSFMNRPTMTKVALEDQPALRSDDALQVLAGEDKCGRGFWLRHFRNSLNDLPGKDCERATVVCVGGLTGSYFAEKASHFCDKGGEWCLQMLHFGLLLVEGVEGIEEFHSLVAFVRADCSALTEAHTALMRALECFVLASSTALLARVSATVRFNTGALV